MMTWPSLSNSSGCAAGLATCSRTFATASSRVRPPISTPLTVVFAGTVGPLLATKAAAPTPIARMAPTDTLARIQCFRVGRHRRRCDSDTDPSSPQLMHGRENEATRRTRGPRTALMVSMRTPAFQTDRLVAFPQTPASAGGSASARAPRSSGRARGDGRRASDAGGFLLRRRVRGVRWLRGVRRVQPVGSQGPSRQCCCG